jgi:hypothetical protein
MEMKPMSAHAPSITEHSLRFPVLAASPARVEASSVIARDETIQSEAHAAAKDGQLTRKALKTGLEIVAAMALGAALVSAMVLSGTMVILGFCVAFVMMLFIGLPLMLASIADAVESH